MSAESSPKKWIKVDGSTAYETDEEALESLVNIKDLDFPDTFTNRDTRLDSGEEQGLSIFWFHDEAYNSLRLNVESEGRINLQLITSEEYIDTSTEILNMMVEKLESIMFGEMMIQESYDISYNALDLPIKKDTDFNVTGIRIQRDSTNYIIQRDEEGDTTTTMIEEMEVEFEGSVPDAFVDDRCEALNSLITEELL